MVKRCEKHQSPLLVKKWTWLVNSTAASVSPRFPLETLGASTDDWAVGPWRLGVTVLGGVVKEKIIYQIKDHLNPGIENPGWSTIRASAGKRRCHRHYNSTPHMINNPVIRGWHYCENTQQMEQHLHISHDPKPLRVCPKAWVYPTQQFQWGKSCWIETTQQTVYHRKIKDAMANWVDFWAFVHPNLPRFEYSTSWNKAFFACLPLPCEGKALFMS